MTSHHGVCLNIKYSPPHTHCHPQCSIFSFLLFVFTLHFSSKRTVLDIGLILFMQRARTALFLLFYSFFLILFCMHFTLKVCLVKRIKGGGDAPPIPSPLSSYAEKRSKRQLYMSLDEMNTKRTEYKP